MVPALTESTQAQIMRRIEADRNGAESPVANYHLPTVTNFTESSLRGLSTHMIRSYSVAFIFPCLRFFDGAFIRGSYD